MAEEKNANVKNLEGAEQLSEPELARVAGGLDFSSPTYIRCNKDYCGCIDKSGVIRYARCRKCNHAMHFETHEFLGTFILRCYCDKCDCSKAGKPMDIWNGTKEELIASANEAL
jgi:hypothetical protein